MRFLLICRPVPEADPETFAQVVPEEAAHLRSLRSLGTLVEAWSPGKPGALLIVEADDDSAAAAMVEQLPLVSAGLVSVETIPLHALNF